MLVCAILHTRLIAGQTGQGLEEVEGREFSVVPGDQLALPSVSIRENREGRIVEMRESGLRPI
jgi:hypothetical protein